jgi:uncharacterized membrane protein
MAVMIAALALTGIWIEGPTQAVTQVFMLQNQDARLLNDFTLYGVGGALLNAASVGALGLILVYFTSINLSGPTLAPILTMIGFSFFGTTVLNSLPIIGGVYVASLYANQRFGSFSIMALFGTAIGPVVTHLMFYIGLPLGFSIPLSLLLGILVGFILPSLASAFLQFHQGYNLYNVGFSCGFLGLFLASVLVALGVQKPIDIRWNDESSVVLLLIVPLFSLFLIALGFRQDKEEHSLAGFREIQNMIGRLPSDFFDSSPFGSTLLNMGTLGLLYWAYVLLIGAPMNGPVVGALLTIIGFGAFGKTVNNTWPIVAGVILATLLFGKSLIDPGPLLAALFCTTLAPLAGQFGKIVGVVSGAIHLTMVEVTSHWHGGFDLYNNGFAGGLTAILVVAILQWFSANKRGGELTL